MVLSLMSVDEKNIRHRFTVPIADTKVNEWIKSQSNLGFSLRVLIKAFVREYGYQDATCLELGTEVKRRGRPPKALKSQIDAIGNEYDDVAVDNEHAVVQQPAQSSITPVQQVQYQTQQPVQAMNQPVPQTIVQQPVTAQPAVQSTQAVSMPQQAVQSKLQQTPAAVNNNDDIMSMMSGMTSATPVPVMNDAISATTDDDGFVDPESLF